jgi:uncharacterized repeat protein (TIGR01451 family)
MTNIRSTFTAVTGLVLLLAFAGNSQNLPAQAPTVFSASATPAPAKKSAIALLRKSPMSFEANEGQTDARVKFISRGAGYTLFLTSDGAVLKLLSSTAAPQPKTSAVPAIGPSMPFPSMPFIGDDHARGAQAQASTEKVEVLNMQVVGANPQEEISALERQTNTSNYFIGNDHSKWRTNVGNYAKVRYADVYRGVDLIYYGNQQQLEYDFVVAPGVDPNVIALRFKGGVAGDKKLVSTIDGTGDLVAHLEGGDVRFHKPVIYQHDGQHDGQDAGGRGSMIEGGYVLRADGQIGFELGAYDHTKELVIDPQLTYSTFLGGSNADVGMGVALDCCGDAFITGSTLSTNFPTENPVQADNAGEKDIFITKIDQNGGALDYSTYVGGSGNDVANDIMLDNLGDMTVTGYTTSTNFPLELPIQGTFGGGSVTGDAVLFQIASHGTALVYSTYFGGSADDEGFSLGLDSSNNVFVVGSTNSTNFPVTPGAFHSKCGPMSSGACSTGFVLEVTVPPGQNQQTSLAYSTYLGGSGGLGDAAYGIWVDNVTVPPPDNAYVVGITGSPNFPVTKSAFDQICGTDGKCNGTYDGFVTEMNSTGNGLVFSTFLGGSGYDYAAGVAVDPTGVYVSGNTTSTNFPITSGAAQKTFGGMSNGCVPSSTTTCGDVTLTKLNSTGSGLIYSTYLGGSGNEGPGLSLALDAGGSVYVTGQTNSTNFPSITPLQSGYVNGATSNAFLTKLNPEGTAFSYSTYIGGSIADAGSRVALDSTTAAYVAGTTTSGDFPITNGAFQPNCASCPTLSDVFAFKLSTSSELSLSASATPKTVMPNQNVTYSFTAGNSGPDDASVVTITDTLPTTPASLTYVSATVSPSGSCSLVTVLGVPPQVVCTVGLQQVGERVRGTMTFTVAPGASGSISSVISASSANSSNSPTVTVTTPVN